MTFLSVRRDVGEFKKRYKWMALAVTLTFFVLLVRTTQLQLIEYGKYAAIARENITKSVQLPATRGMIRDTAGRVLAANRPSYNVYVIPQLLDPEVDIPRMMELMELDSAQRSALEERIARVPPRRRAQQILAFRDITRDQLAALETHAPDLPAMDVVATPIRTYPFGQLGAHAIGYLNEISAEELEKQPKETYLPGDRVGRSGVEQAWESYLRGRRGLRRVLVDARGRGRSADVRGQALAERDPIPGRDIQLTIDMELMKIIDRAFRAHPSGAAVVVDVHSGRIRALYSKPSYDLNEISSRLLRARAEELQRNPYRPLIDKTVYDTYYPGSTFKPVSAIAALEGNILDPAERVSCPGYYELGKRRFRCSNVHGETDMQRALVRSCNVYFYKLAESVGLDRLAKYAFELGFGERTGIGINSEARGFIPTREWYTKRYDDRFRLGFTLNAAIGQGNTRVTLLQLAMAYAAIANGGKLYVPELVEKVSSPDGTLIEEFPPRVRRAIHVQPAHLQYVVAGLVGVVNDREGTAFEVRNENGVEVGGKTGTAQVYRRTPKEGENPRIVDYLNRDHAWFAGFAPVNDPQVVAVVLVEHGGGGGRNAAPVAIEILQSYLGGKQTGPEVTQQANADATEPSPNRRRQR